MAIPVLPITNRKKKKTPTFADLLAPIHRGQRTPVTHKKQTQEQVIKENYSQKKIPIYQSNELQKTIPTKKELNHPPGTPTGRRVESPNAVSGNSSGPRRPVGSFTNTAQRISGRKKNGGEQFVDGSKTEAGQHSGSGDKVGKTKDSLLHRAKESIAAQMNPQLAEYRQEILDTKTSGKQQGADLEDLYRRLGIQLDANKIQGDAFNADALKKLQDNYRSLSGNIDSTYDKASSDTNAELSRLGISEVSPAANAQTGLDHDFLSKLTTIDRTNAETNSGAKSQSFDNLLSTLQGQAGLAGTQDRSRVLRDTAKAVADLRSKKGALAATRRGAVDVLYHQLKDAQTQQEADAAQQNFMNQIAAGKLGIEQGNLGVAQGKLALDQINSSSERDLRTAQALKYIRDSKAPYTSGSSSSKPQGFGAGLSLLKNSKTGQNQAAKSAVKNAEDIYTNLYTKYGGKALSTLEQQIKAGSATHYLKLPKSLQATVIDALRLSGAN